MTDAKSLSIYTLVDLESSLYSALKILFPMSNVIIYVIIFLNGHTVNKTLMPYTHNITMVILVDHLRALLICMLHQCVYSTLSLTNRSLPNMSLCEESNRTVLPEISFSSSKNSSITFGWVGSTSIQQTAPLLHHSGSF